MLLEKIEGLLKEVSALTAKNAEEVEQLRIKYRFTRYKYVAFNGGRDAHFHIIAGQRQGKALGLQVDALQHRDGGAVGDRAGNAVDGIGQQGLFTFKFHTLFSRPLVQSGAKSVCFFFMFSLFRVFHRRGCYFPG